MDKDGLVVQNGQMAVRVVCDLGDAGDLWCIHHDLDWRAVLRDGITRTIQAHLPRGLCVRVSVDVRGRRA